MDAGRHAQRCQPIALKLVLAEGYVPLQNAVKLTDQPLPTFLPTDALRLLAGRQLQLTAQDVDSRQLLTAVVAHGFAQGQRLGKQRPFRKKMPGVGNAVFSHQAPMRSP